ncbi:hypothetical protein [Cellulomonas sp. HZM]|uniref:hypothetical protein n=1 Tax=Cellulomonas sp. HZM TaxID=1454010 RepID=UPI000493630C|nr:hypothetical protein [Cellulomonas sp. HZM]
MDDVTDVLDLLGLLVLVAAASVAAGAWCGLVAALAVAGGGLLAVSWLLDAVRRPRRRRRAAVRR